MDAVLAVRLVERRQDAETHAPPEGGRRPVERRRLPERDRASAVTPSSAHAGTSEIRTTQAANAAASHDFNTGLLRRDSPLMVA
jgi:hypothetical protein